LSRESAVSFHVVNRTGKVIQRGCVVRPDRQGLLVRRDGEIEVLPLPGGIAVGAASVVLSAGISGVIGELDLGGEIDPGGNFGNDSEAIRQLVTSSVSKTFSTLLTPSFTSFLSSLGSSPEGASLNEALSH